jgi:Domain of unknown function (DUF4410)
MMRSLTLALIGLLLLPAASSAKDAEPQFKTIEAKHFTRAEGVELSPQFTDYLYAELRSELAKTKMFAQVTGEGEAVEDADAPRSLVIDGMITEYKSGNVAKAVIIGFGAGLRSLKISATVKRRSDQVNVASVNVHIKISPRWREEIMAKAAAHDIASEVKKALKQLAKNS